MDRQRGSLLGRPEGSDESGAGSGQDSSFNFAKARRSVLRRSVTNEFNRLDTDFVTITETNLENAVISHEKLQQLRVNLPPLDAIVGSYLTAANKETELADDIERSEAYQETLVNAVAGLSHRVAAFEKLRQVSASASVLPRSPVQFEARGPRHKLLDVDIMKFKGDPTQWEEFIDDFLATVDKKSQYSQVEKFKILKGSLEGEPKEMIRGLLLTDANYDQAKQMLEERYSNKQQRRFAHFDALLAIAPVDHQTNRLREMRDKCEAHMRSLVALGYDEDRFGELFIPILLRKLPKFVKMEICRKKGSGDWTLKRFRELLKEEIEVRDTCEHSCWKEKDQRVVVKSSKNYSKCDQKSADHTLIAETEKQFKGGGRSTSRCFFCGGPHRANSCRAYPDAPSRLAQIKDKRCPKCLREGHNVTDCTSPYGCWHCERKDHNIALCPKLHSRKGNERDNTNVVYGEEDISHESLILDSVSVAAGKHRGRAVMETAEAVVAGTCCEAKARLLFDTASTLSFITSSLARQIGAKYLRTEASSVGRFRDSKRSTTVYRVYEVEVLLSDGSKRSITVFGVDVICTPVQVVPLAASHRGVLSSVRLAEPLLESSNTVEVDILVGLNAYHTFFEDAQIRLTDQLILKKSVLGWIASGFDRDSIVGSGENAHLILEADVRTAEMFDVERFWALDEIGIRDDPGSVDDETALKFFNDTIRFEEGRYQVKWPFKDPKPNLPTNRMLSLRRLKSLWSKLKDEQGKLLAYDKIFRDQLERGMIEIAPEKPDGLEHYLPHHAVVKDSSATTKLRIVFDASAKASKNAMSLNDCLYRGPVLTL